MEIKAQPSATLSTAPLHQSRQLLTPSPEGYEEFKGRQAPATRRLLRIVDWSRIALALLLITAGSAAVGCEGHALYTYNSTHLSNEWFLPLWPQHFDLRPSVGILTGASVVIFTSCVYLMCAILPAVREPPSDDCRQITGRSHQADTPDSARPVSSSLLHSL